MNSYCAFLRAVNVGGSKIIKMELLKKIFESAGLKDVKTFIQSGNVLFASEEKDPGKVKNTAEAAMLIALNYKVTAAIRSKKEMQDIINKNPFDGVSTGKDLMLYLTLLASGPSKNTREVLEGLSNANEEFRLVKNNIYCLINKKVKTLYSNNWLEKKLGLEATTRNINSMVKINNLLSTY